MQRNVLYSTAAADIELVRQNACSFHMQVNTCRFCDETNTHTHTYTHTIIHINILVAILYV